MDNSATHYQIADKVSSIQDNLGLDRERVNIISTNVNNLAMKDYAFDKDIKSLSKWRSNVNTLLNGVVPGEVYESKAVIADENKDVTGFNNVGITNTLLLSSNPLITGGEIYGTNTGEIVIKPYGTPGTVTIDGNLNITGTGGSGSDENFTAILKLSLIHI